MDRLLLLGIAYMIFVGYNAGIYSTEQLWILAPSLLPSISNLMGED